MLCDPLSPKREQRFRPGNYSYQAFSRNSYRPRSASFSAFDVAFRYITSGSPLGLYIGHFGNPVPFGSPFRAKFVQYFRTCSLSALSSPRQRSGILHSSVPKTYSISQEWNAPIPASRDGSSGGARSKR